nr:sugar carrier protein C [Ipomoea batatas]
MFTSSLYLAALVSSMVASYVTRKMGRQTSLMTGGFIFLVGALLNGFAQALWILIISRVLLGFGIGFANQSIPLYLGDLNSQSGVYAFGVVLLEVLTGRPTLDRRLFEEHHNLATWAIDYMRKGNVDDIVIIIVTVCIGVKVRTSGNPEDLPMWFALVVVIFMCTYVAGFAWSWGPLDWLMRSEIFPPDIRSVAQSINVSLNMIFTFAQAPLEITNTKKDVGNKKGNSFAHQE